MRETAVPAEVFERRDANAEFLAGVKEAESRIELGDFSECDQRSEREIRNPRLKPVHQMVRDRS